MRRPKQTAILALLLVALASVVLTDSADRGTGWATAGASGQVHEFTLTAEPVRWEIQPGMVLDGWGYNGQVPGPRLRVREGDLVRIRLVNRLPVDTTIHWHGIDVPPEMDGVPGLSQRPVEPGQEFIYEFIATNPGTRMYHSHTDTDTQMQLGLFGAFIIDPIEPEPVQYDREFTYILTEKALDLTPAVALGEADIAHRNAGNGRGGALQYDLFLMNGKSGSAIEPFTVAPGEKVRVRLINLGNLVHAMHLHGHSFTIIATDGNPVPSGGRWLKDTVNIAPGERYDIEVSGTNPGVWAFHCHINNHAANGMSTLLVYDGAKPAVDGDLGHGSHGAPAARPGGSTEHSGHATPTAAPSPAPVTATPATTTGTADGMVVAMLDDRFRDARISIKAGTTVTWINRGRNLHTTSSLDALWDSGNLQRDETFSFTFTEPGTYNYLCRVHIFQNMRGTVVVEGH